MVERSLSMREVAGSMPASSILSIIYIQRRISYDHTTKVELEIKVRDANCRWSGVYTGLNPTAARRVVRPALASAATLKSALSTFEYSYATQSS